MVQQLCAAFREKHGSIICRELLGLDRAEGSPQASPRTPQYYHDRRCGEFCRDAADLLAGFLEQAAAQE